MILPLVVLVRILANPLSNVFQKVLTRRGVDPLFIILLTHTLLAAVCLPIGLAHFSHLSQTFWTNMAIVAVLTVAGNALLVEAVRRSDLSVLGPVNAYKAIVSLVPGMLLLHEFPGRVGLLGMALIVAGSYFVVDKRVSEPRANVFVRFVTDRGVQFRLAAMALSATEAVFLKKALLASTPLDTFAWWAILGCLTALLAVALLRGKETIAEIRATTRHPATSLALTTTTGLMQLCTIITFAGFQVGYALALFQTSTLLTVLLGWKIFAERNIVERMIGAVIMTAGAILIVLAR